MANYLWLLFFPFCFVLYRSIRHGMRHRKLRTEPTCAACGYAVVGLTTTTCPECGKDLVLEGIIPPGKSGIHVYRALAVSILIYLTSVLSAHFVAMIHYYNAESVIWLFGSAGATDDSMVIVDSYAAGYSPSLSPDSVNVYCFGPAKTIGTRVHFSISHFHASWRTTVPDGPRATIASDPKAGGWILTDPTGSRHVSVLADIDMLNLLSSIGCPADLLAAHELAELTTASRSTANLAAFRPPRTARWTSTVSSGGGNTGPTDTIWSIFNWSYFTLWAWSLRYTLFGKPRALCGIDAAHLLKQPVTS